MFWLQQYLYFPSVTEKIFKRDSSNESLLTLYESAWYQTYNKSFDVMSKWLPVTGENASFWDADSEIFSR